MSGVMHSGMAAKIVAATLALVAAVYTVTHFLIEAKVEVYEEWGENIEDRLTAVEMRVFPLKDQVIIKERGTGESKEKDTGESKEKDTGESKEKDTGESKEK